MPRVKIDYVVSFSSESPDAPASNLLASEAGSGRWLCTRGEPSCSVLLQLSKAVQISSITIGAHLAALVEVLVGRSETPNDQYKVLVASSVFLSPLESRKATESDAAADRVRSFSGGQLAADVSGARWDRVRVQCSQPYNKHCKYGLSFIHIFSPEAESSEAAPRPVLTKAALKMPVASPVDSDDDEFKPGALFAQHRAKAQETASTDAQIRQATSQALKHQSDNSAKIVRTPISKPKGDSTPKDKDQPRSDRHRDSLLYAGEGDPHDKIDRVVAAHKDQVAKTAEKANEEDKRRKDKEKERDRDGQSSKEKHDADSSKHRKDKYKDDTAHTHTTPKDKHKSKNTDDSHRRTSGDYKKDTRDSHRRDTNESHRKDRVDSHRSDSHRSDSHRSDSHRSDSHRSDSHRSDSHRSDFHKSDKDKNRSPHSSKRDRRSSSKQGKNEDRSSKKQKDVSECVCAGPVSEEPHTLLSDVDFVLSGYENPRRGRVRDAALAMGARFHRDWGPKCTHLICAFSNTPKLKSVRASPDGHRAIAVTAEWVERCAARQRRLPWQWFATEPAKLVTRTRSASGEDPPGTSGNTEATGDSPKHADGESPNKTATIGSDRDTDDEIERVMQANAKKRQRATSAHSEESPSKKQKKQEQEETLNSSRESDVAFVRDERVQGNVTVGDSDSDVTDKMEETTEEQDISTIAGLPSFFEGSTFALHVTGSPTVDDRLLRRYVTAYGGDIVEAQQDKELEVDYVLCLSEDTTGVTAKGRRVRGEWVWACHERGLRCSPRDFAIV